VCVCVFGYLCACVCVLRLKSSWASTCRFIYVCVNAVVKISVTVYV
jgi:hypothetical protein